MTPAVAQREEGAAGRSPSVGATESCRRRGLEAVRWIVPLAALILFVGCAGGSGDGSVQAIEQPVAEPIAVSVIAPQRREIADRITLPGTVTADEQVTLYAKVTGYLKSIHVDIGDHVRQGQFLAEIDVPEMDASLEEKRAAVAKAEAVLEQARASLGQHEAEFEFQKANYNRLSAIRERDAELLPQQQVDQARAGFGVAESKLSMARADIRVAEASAQAARAELETLNRLADYVKIVAPLTGVVTERFVDPGELVQAASSSRTQVAPIVSLARVSRVRVVADIPEPSSTRVQPGTPATIRFEGTGETASTRVARTAGVLNPGTKTLRVELDLPNSNRRLRPGMTAMVTLELHKIPDALMIPASAIQSTDEGQAVFVVEGGVARRRGIHTGLETSEWIQVLDGLQGAEHVVVTSSAPLTEGSPVAVLGA